MKILVIPLLIGMVVAFLASAAWVIIRLLTGEAASPTDITPPFIAAGVMAALLALLVKTRREESEDYLQNALQLLERAYAVLASEVKAGASHSSRLNWLSAARLFRTSEAVAKRIKEPSQQEIWATNKEYWRTQFRDLLFADLQGQPVNYFAEDPAHCFVHDMNVRPPIEERSLAVLYRFVNMSRSHDPVIDEPRFSDEEIEDMLTFGPRGLGIHLQNVREYAAGLEEDDE